MKYFHFVHVPKAAGHSIRSFFYNKFLYKGIDVFNCNTLNHLDGLAHHTFDLNTILIKTGVTVILHGHEIYMKK
jgi:hypothetical protein